MSVLLAYPRGLVVLLKWSRHPESRFCSRVAQGGAGFATLPRQILPQGLGLQEE